MNGECGNRHEVEAEPGAREYLVVMDRKQNSKGDKEKPWKLDGNQEGLVSWKQGQECSKDETTTNHVKCHCQEDQEAAMGLTWGHW